MISIRSVSFTYAGGGPPALRGVSLEVNRGDFLVVTGPTGSGKSTLLRLLNGLVPHFYQGAMGGKVTIYGQDTRTTPVAGLACTVAMVFQNPEDQMVGATVERDVAFALENRLAPPAEMRRTVNSTLQRLGIRHLRHRSPDELSGGEKQLAAIAAAVASGAPVIVLDEPTAELDRASAEAVFSLLRHLHAQGMTLVVAEHRLEGLLPMVSRAAVLDGGCLVADGGPRDLVAWRFERLGLGLPAASRVALALRRRGVDVGRPLANDELVSALKRI